MQRADGLGRGFSVSHQKVALELSFTSQNNVIIQGYTELIISPNDKYLKTLHLNAKQVHVQRITCSGQDAEFSIVDHSSNIVLSEKDVHKYPELKRKLFAASSDGAGGELDVLLPFDVVQETNQDAASDFVPIPVRIYYTITDPKEAVQIVMPSDEAPHRIPHIFTSATGPDATRSWLPCVDSLWERCTWELEFIVPKTLDGEMMTVIASGDLIEKVIHPHNSNKSIFYFSQASATSAQHIGFAAGPFVMYDIPLAKRDEPSGRAVAFCLPGREEEMFNSVAVVHQALDFYSREFGSYPFGSMSVVFVDEPIHDVHNTSTLAICSSDLLHPPTVIDQALETRQILSHCVAFQWIGINIIQKTWSDTWLINGLSLYISGLFMRRLLGNNEYRFRLKKDCDRLLTWDIGMPPLYISGRQEAPEEDYISFINLKAPLVLHILDRRLCKAGATLGLGRAIPKVFLQAITGEMVNATLSTSNFLRTCRKVSGIELRRFSEQWIYGSGCPTFVCNANFNKKKLLIEFNFHQYTPSWDYAQRNPLEAAGSNPVQLFEGQMTVRIHEADGTPYEHVFDMNDAQRRFEVPFNTKYKRVRRNTKRFKSRQAAAKAAAEGDEGAQEDISLMDLGFGLGMWEEEEQREKWRVADWTEEEEAQMSSAPYEWIRMDADFEWIAHIQFDQKDYMWVSQLQRDRDVVAQAAAIQALGRTPNAIASSMLTRTVLVTKYFFRIRIEAIHQLVGCALKSLDYLGLFHLLMLFRTSYCHETSNNTDLDAPSIPKANDFSDYADYFVKRALIQAISNVRNQHGRSLPQVKRFIINLLRYNDNSKNRFVDDFYIAGLISCLAHAFVPLDSHWGQYVPANEDPSAIDDDMLLASARQEVERFQELDRLVPSFHNVVSMSCLDFQGNLMLANITPVNLPLLHSYTRQGNYTSLRIAALDYLLLIHGLQHKILTRYFFALLRSDESRAVKRALARSICQSMAVFVAVGENRDRAVIDESPNGKTEEQQLDESLKIIRKEVGRSASVREGFLEAILHPGVDIGERWALLKLGELLFKPSEEHEVPFQPKLSVRVRMPSLAEQVEQASSAKQRTESGTPKIKLVRTEATPRVAFEDKVSATPAAPVKKKKVKPAAPGQASGMTLTDLTACRNALKRLQNSKHSSLFRKPVDPVRDKVPDYFNVIQNPMDLSSIENKLNEGMYKDRFEFKEDFELVINNAKQYTPDPKAFVHTSANSLNREFQTLWNRITKTLAHAAANNMAATNGNANAEETPEIRESAEAEEASPAPESQEVQVKMPMAPPAAPARAGLKIKLKPRLSTDNAQSEDSPTPADRAYEPDVKQPTPKPQNARASSKVVEESHFSRTPSPAAHRSRTSSPVVVREKARSPIASRSPSVKLANGSKSANGTGNVESLPIQTKKCKALLQTLKKMPEAGIFLQPVDPVRDGAPTYLDEIKHPMDLGTMTEKLNEGKYSTMGQFKSDMELIFANCRQYNPPTTIPIQLTDAVEAAFEREWRIASILKLEPGEIKTLQALLKKLTNIPEAFIFLQPVDPIALQIPHYHDIIPKKNARDLETIGKKLTAGQYGTLYEFDADIRLMLQNCFTFNADVDDILATAKAFEKQYDKLWSEIRSKYGLAKRKANGLSSDMAAGNSSAKRQKK
ncbi:hypothetical protein L7F22_019378 [Adiantum nelumboides]|nr:hypothetical protein [Adiantum nelumboides]